MSDAADESTIALHDQGGSGGVAGWDPPANAHRDEALRHLRGDPVAVERIGVAIERELERRWTLFDGASDDTPQR